MAAPTVTVGDPDNSFGTSHGVTLPTFAVGDLLIILFVNYDNTITATMAAGWTSVTRTTASFRLTQFSRVVAAPGEPSSPTVTTSGSTEASKLSYKFQNGAMGNVTPTASGTGTTPAAGTFSPGESFSPDDAIQLAVAGWQGNFNVSAFPSGYSNTSSETYTASDPVGVGAATKVISSSEDGISFSLDGSATGWTAWSQLITYSLSNVTIELTTGELDLASDTIAQPTVFFALDAGELDLTSDVANFIQFASLAVGELDITVNTATGVLFNPVFLDAGELDVAGDAATAYIATNIDLATGELDLVADALVAQYTINLATGELDVSIVTQLFAYELTRNQIKKIDISSPLWDLTLLEPAAVQDGDYYGALLVNPSGTGRSVVYGFTAYPTPTPLTVKGHLIVFRRVDGESYVWKEE